jgi:hypothetical protein
MFKRDYFALLLLEIALFFIFFPVLVLVYTIEELKYMVQEFIERTKKFM